MGQKGAAKTPEVRFVTDMRGPERATKTREYDLLRIRVGQKQPPRPGSTMEYEFVTDKSEDPGVRFATDKSGRETPTRTTNKSGPERATKTRE